MCHQLLTAPKLFYMCHQPGRQLRSDLRFPVKIVTIQRIANVPDLKGRSLSAAIALDFYIQLQYIV
jgi:hypothetical protein